LLLFYLATLSITTIHGFVVVNRNVIMEHWWNTDRENRRFGETAKTVHQKLHTQGPVIK